MPIKKKIAFGIAVIIVMLAMGSYGCSMKKQPTNADIVKAAIQRAVNEQCNIITPSISVVSKTAVGDTWSIALRYQCGGLANAGKQKEMTLSLAPSRDSSGHTVWTTKERGEAQPMKIMRPFWMIAVLATAVSLVLAV